MQQEKQVLNDQYYFLQGGGKMGELTRSFDWSQTIIGTPNQWPQSLRITVAMILSSRFPMFLWWGEELIQFYNDAYRPSLGNNGKHPLALAQKAKDCWPEIWNVIFPLIESVRKTGEATWSEDQLIPIYRNGKIEDVYWTFGYSPIRDESGKVAGVLVVCNETTEKVQTVNKLVESEKRFQNLIRDATVGIVVLVGENMVVEIVNDAYAGLINHKQAELIGKPIFEIIPETEPYFRSIIDRVRSTGEPLYLYDHPYFILVNAVKREGFLNLVYQPYKETDGTITGVMILVQDVTEQVTARLKLKQSEENLRNTILKAPVAMCIFRGPQYIVEIANDRMLEFWGKAGTDVMHRPIFEGLPEARHQGFEQLLNQVYITGETVTSQGVTVTLPRSEKADTVYVNFVYAPYRDADGVISGVIAVVTEVTDQVLARQKIEEEVTARTRELAEVNSNLQKSNAELGQFAYITSHDLQEPLRKISVFSQMLEENMNNADERSRHYLNKINNASSRMAALIKDVLAYSQLSKEKEVFERVSLQQVVLDIITDFELLIEQKQASIQYIDLPQIEAIPRQMSQLFSNLISNALKFSRPGIEPVIAITATHLPEEEKSRYTMRHMDRIYYKIEVSDNGIGFNQEYAEQIFNIFQRLHTTADYSGTGIGLSLCRKIAQNHHGDIYAIANNDKGALFYVILPAEQSGY